MSVGGREGGGGEWDVEFSFFLNTLGILLSRISAEHGGMGMGMTIS